MATQGTSAASRMSHHPHLDIRLILNAYSLVATPDIDQFRNLYELGDCGANLEEVIFEFGTTDIFFTFRLQENVQLAREEAHRQTSLQPKSSGNRNFYPGSKFGVIARSGNKAPVLFFRLCNCPTCKQSADVNPSQLKSISIIAQLNIGGSQFSAKFPFRPICKEEYNMGLPLSKNLEHVLYYTNYWTIQPALRDFITHLCSIRVPEEHENADIKTTIRLKSVAEVDAALDDNHKTLQDMLYDRGFADFQLISSYDGITYNCHKAILSVQSKELKIIVLRKQAKEEPLQSRNKLMLTENGTTISAFLQWIYLKSELPISSSFEVAAGLLRLGHEYNLPNLIAAAAQMLMQKVESADPDWNTPTALWKLYEFVRLLDKIDVVVRLKIAIVTKLAKNLVKRKLEKVRDSATDEMKALNGGEPVDPVAANDFIFDVVDLGKFDE